MIYGYSLDRHSLILQCFLILLNKKELQDEKKHTCKLKSTYLEKTRVSMVIILTIINVYRNSIDGLTKLNYLLGEKLHSSLSFSFIISIDSYKIISISRHLAYA